MSYLITQIALCLLAVMVVSALAGWLLRGSGKEHLREMEDEMQRKLTKSEKDRDYYATELQSMTSLNDRWEGRENKLVEEKKALQVSLKETEQAAVDSERRLKDHFSSIADDQRVNSQRMIEMEDKLKETREHIVVKDDQITELKTTLEIKDEEMLSFRDQLGKKDQELTAVRQQFQTKDDELNITKQHLVQQTDALRGKDSLLAEKDNLISRSNVEIEQREGLISKLKSTATEQAAKAKDAVASLSAPSMSMPSVNTPSVRSPSVDAPEVSAPNLDVVQDTGKIKGLLGIGGLAGIAGLAKSTYGKAVDGVQKTKVDLMTRPNVADESVYPLSDVKAITRSDRERLADAGVEDTAKLLEKCKTQGQISLMAKMLGREAWVVRSWASAADIARVKGVSVAQAEMLELSGVHSVKAMSDRDPLELHNRLEGIHRQFGKEKMLPEQEELRGWMSIAALLDPVVEDPV